MMSTQQPQAIVGHNFVQQCLQKSLISGKIAHAMFFYGPEHVGKATLVRFFVSAILCRSLSGSPRAGDLSLANLACGTCASCQSFRSMAHPDLYWFDRDDQENNKAGVSIQTVREIHKHLTVSSFFSKYKVAVIDGAQHLTPEASNALLKILEEPPQGAVIILLAKTLQYLPKTLLSRCQVMPMFPVSQAALYPWLVGQVTDRDQALTLSRESYGRPGMAHIFANEPKTRSDFHDGLRFWLEIFEADSLAQRFGIIDSAWPKSVLGQGLRDWVQQSLVYGVTIARDVMYLQLGHEEYVHAVSFLGRLRQIAKKYEIVDLLFHIERLQKSQEALQKNVQPKLLFDSLLSSL